MLLPEPIYKHDEFASNEEQSKDEFVVLGQPNRQIDIEVGGALVCEPGSQV